MTSFIKASAATALIVTASSGAFSAMPTSIKYIEDVVIQNNLIYSHYTVTCSDGRTANISAWNNRKKWCVGKGGQDICSNKQIKTAKEVCK